MLLWFCTFIVCDCPNITTTFDERASYLLVSLKERLSSHLHCRPCRCRSRRRHYRPTLQVFQYWRTSWWFNNKPRMPKCRASRSTMNSTTKERKSLVLSNEKELYCRNSFARNMWNQNPLSRAREVSYNGSCMARRLDLDVALPNLICCCTHHVHPGFQTSLTS